MHQHTIIFKTGQIIVPEKVDRDFLLDLLKVGQLQLDYFGMQLDNQNEFPEEESLLEFHFDTQESLDYSMQESELKHLVSQFINIEKTEIRVSGNDIIVYF